MKRQYYLTVAEGKRLIARALAQDPRVLDAAQNHTLVIVAGTTNGYIVEELFRALGLGEFDRSTFFRGIFKGPKAAHMSSVVEDIVIREGKVIRGKVITDIEPELKGGDMILKGGSAVYLPDAQAGVVIGNERLGTLSPINAAHYGRRVQVIIPVGLEKRVDDPIADIVNFVNAPDMTGTRMAIAPGEAYTELDALESTGVDAFLLAAGGVGGYEGSVLIGIEGDEEDVDAADGLIRSVKGEPGFADL